MDLEQREATRNSRFAFADEPGEFNHSLDRHSSVPKADQDVNPLDIAVSVTAVTAFGPVGDKESEAFVVSQCVGRQAGA